MKILKLLLAAILFATICSAQTSTALTRPAGDITYVSPGSTITYFSLGTFGEQYSGTQSKAPLSNDNLVLNYNVPVPVRVAGIAVDNVTERPVNTITFTSSSTSVQIAITSDPLVFNVTNANSGGTGTGSIYWSAKNELNQTISSGGQSFTLVPANPATHLDAKIVP